VCSISFAKQLVFEREIESEDEGVWNKKYSFGTTTVEE